MKKNEAREVAAVVRMTGASREVFELRVLKTTRVVHVAVYVPNARSSQPGQAKWAGLLCDSGRTENEVAVPTAKDLRPDNFCKSCQKYMKIRQISWEQIRKPQHKHISSAILDGLNRLSGAFSAKSTNKEASGIFTELDLCKRNARQQPIGRLKIGPGSVWNKALERLTSLYEAAERGKVTITLQVVQRMALRLYISPNLATAILAHLAAHGGKPPTLADMEALVGKPVPELPQFPTRKNGSPAAEPTEPSVTEEQAVPEPAAEEPPVGKRLAASVQQLLLMQGVAPEDMTAYRHIGLGEHRGFTVILFERVPSLLPDEPYDLIMTESDERFRICASGEPIEYTEGRKCVELYSRGPYGKLRVREKNRPLLEHQLERWLNKIERQLKVYDQEIPTASQKTLMNRFRESVEAAFRAGGEEIRQGAWLTIPAGDDKYVIVVQEGRLRGEPLEYRITKNGQVELLSTLQGEPIYYRNPGAAAGSRNIFILHIQKSGYRLFDPWALEQIMPILAEWSAAIESGVSAVAAARAAREEEARRRAAEQEEKRRKAEERIAALALAAEKSRTTNRRKKAEFQDVGEYIPLSRKEEAARMREQLMQLWAEREEHELASLESAVLSKLAEIEQADMTEAYEAVTKQNLLGERFDPQEYRLKGFSSGATYLIYHIYRDIADRPQEVTVYLGIPRTWKDVDRPDLRHDYVQALLTLMDQLKEARTVEMVQRGLDAFKRIYVERYGANRYEKMGVLGEHLFKRVIYTTGDTWRNRKEKAEEYERTDDWSWAMPNKSSRGDGHSSGESGGTARSPRRKRIRQPVLKEAIRRGGKPTPTHKAEDFLTVFGVKGVMFGNWVDDREAEIHVTNCGAALQDLAEILELEPTDLFANGFVSLSFGSHGRGGRIKAAYQPGIRNIYFTKNFIGGMAHEWGHFLDNYLYLQSHGHQVGNVNRFASELAFGQKIHPAVKEAFEAWYRAVYQTPSSVIVRYDPLQADPNGRVKPYHPYHLTDAKFDVSAALRNLASKPGVGTAELLKTGHFYCKLAAEYGRPVEQFELPLKTSAFLYHARRLDAGRSPYYAVPTELFARSFEAYVEDRLAAAGQVNTYLVYGTQDGGVLWYVDQYEPGDPLLYPVGEERRRISEAIDRIITAVRTAGVLKRKREKGV